MTKPVTVTTLKAKKDKHEKISCITAYDATFSTLADQAGIDVILVGDSLGMVIQGHDSTVPVSLSDMVYHTRCVTKSIARPLVIADMPFLSYTDKPKAIDAAAQLMQQGGAQMVKLEGGEEQAGIVNHMTSRGIPVCAHLGLQPQYVHKLGGYRVQGKSPADAEKMVASAKALVEAGADLIILECVPSALAEQITRAVAVPVIGIGAGKGCDGQVLVMYDILGVSTSIPKFAKNFMTGADDILSALCAYRQDVDSGAFPMPENILA